jgi:hypothetical protein
MDCKKDFERKINIKSTNMNRRILHLTVLTILLLIVSCSKSKHYELSIVDEQTAEQLAARVSVTNQTGQPVHIDGTHTDVEYLGKIWCYTDGSCSVTTTEKGLNLEIRRGPETLPVKLLPDMGPDKQVIKLRKWIDMQQTGYLNGDIHIHTPLSETALLQMKAEDLDVLNILVGEDSVKNRQFTGKKDPGSTPGHTIYVAQEVRDWQMGHLTLLGLSSMVPGYPIVGGTLESYTHTHWLMSHAMDETHRQGGVVAWSHFSNLPGAESPVAIALGKIDALELMTYDDPTQLPSHWGPWKNSGMPTAEFPVLRGMDIWYQYLNAGFKLPIVAGTDKMADDIPMGSNRYYAFTNGDTTYSAWLSAIKSGHGFITNGPILTFDAEGHASGETVDFSGTMKVHARVTAQSILPFATLEIIVNGWVKGHKTIFTSDNPPVGGIYTMNVEADLVLDKSCWIAARVAEDPDNKLRILPRGLSIFAHTNPVYFIRNGEKIKDDASIDYLRKYVMGTIHWLQTNPEFDNPDDRTEALRLAGEALQVYESLKK